MISAGKALARRGGHFDLLEKRMSAPGVLNSPLPTGPIVTDNSLAPLIEGSRLPPGHLSSLSCVIRVNPSVGVGRTIVAGGPLISPRSSRPKCNVHGV